VVLFLLVVFLLVPVAELASIVAVGQWLGYWQAFALLFAISVAGAVLVRHQGIGAWRRIRADLRAGQVPAVPAIDGALVLLAGVLLLVPGFITDLIGLVLLVPPVRAVTRRLGTRRFTRRVRYVDAVSRPVGARRLNP
jgi:UPF0716 protein FxsA